MGEKAENQSKTREKSKVAENQVFWLDFCAKKKDCAYTLWSRRNAFFTCEVKKIYFYLGHGKTNVQYQDIIMRISKLFSLPVVKGLRKATMNYFFLSLIACSGRCSAWCGGGWSSWRNICASSASCCRTLNDFNNFLCGRNPRLQSHMCRDLMLDLHWLMFANEKKDFKDI